MPEDKKDTSTKIVDTKYHSTTHISTRGKHETSVYEFRNPRKSVSHRYKANEGILYAITDLADKTNSAISNGSIPGSMIELGDIVQAGVVGFIVGATPFLPERGSPEYVSLWYEITQAKEGGYNTAKLSLPEGAEDAFIHTKIPETVGELIPNLKELIEAEKNKTNQEKIEVEVGLQLIEKQHKHKPTKEDVENLLVTQSITIPGYKLKLDENENLDDEANSFFGGGLKEEVEGAGKEEHKDLNDYKKVSKKDIEDFGFNKIK